MNWALATCIIWTVAFLLNLVSYIATGNKMLGFIAIINFAAALMFLLNWLQGRRKSKQ